MLHVAFAIAFVALCAVVWLRWKRLPAKPPEVAEIKPEFRREPESEEPRENTPMSMGRLEPMRRRKRSKPARRKKKPKRRMLWDIV